MLYVIYYFILGDSKIRNNSAKGRPLDLISDQILSKAYAASTNVIKTTLTAVVFQLI